MPNKKNTYGRHGLIICPTCNKIRLPVDYERCPLCKKPNPLIKYGYV